MLVLYDSFAMIDCTSLAQHRALPVVGTFFLAALEVHLCVMCLRACTQVDAGIHVLLSEPMSSELRRRDRVGLANPTPQLLWRTVSDTSTSLRFLSPQTGSRNMASSSASDSSSMPPPPPPSPASVAVPEAARSSSGFSAYASRFPAPAKTGDESADEQAKAFRVCAMHVVDFMISDPPSALAIYQKERDRRDKAALLQPNVSADDQFAPGEISIVSKIPKDFVISAITKISDLTNDDVLKATKFDEQAPRYLLMLATGWASSLQIPNEAMVKDVMMEVIVKRATVMGNRLAEFKRRGSLKADGSILWKNGVFKLVWAGDTEDAKLKQIVHISGDAIDVPKSAITRSWTLANYWSDWDARLEMCSAKQQVCHFFNKTKIGPYRNAKLAGNNKAFKEHVVEVAKLYHQQNASKEQEKQETNAVREGLQAMEKDKRKQRLEKARVAAEEMATQTKKRRTLTCEKSAT